MIGVSLVTGISLGLSNPLKSFILMIISGTYPPACTLVAPLLGQLILLDGVIILSKVGSMKNKNNEGTKTAKEKGTSSPFITGLVMALASGAGSAATNTDATAANYPVALAVKEGVNPTSVSLLSRVVVFAGGFLTNFVYAISRLIKNKIYTDHTKPGYAKARSKVVLTPIIWFSALVICGETTALLDTLGPVMGWVTFNGLALIVANTWGFLDEEQRGFERTRCVAIYGNAVIITALVVASISDGL